MKHNTHIECYECMYTNECHKQTMCVCVRERESVCVCVYTVNMNDSPTDKDVKKIKEVFVNYGFFFLPGKQYE